MSEPRDEARPGESAGAGEPAGQTAQRPQADSLALQDRVAVHLVWEGILLVIAVVLVIAALVTTTGAHLSIILDPVGYLGLIASGFALSLRTGTPNLAVGSIAVAAGVLGTHLATADHWSLWGAMTLAVLLAAITGLISGLVAGLLSVPAWAVTLATAILVQAAALGISGEALLPLRTGSYPGALWVAVFVVVSVGGGVLWLLPAVRTRLSAARNAAEPGRWAGLPAGLGAVAGLAGSSLLAGLGGASLTIFEGEADPTQAGLNLTIIALAAVLLGGVSVFGRRAGVTGTVFGVVIVQAVSMLLEAHNVSRAWDDVPFGTLALLGLGVSRALESINDALDRPRTPGPFVPPGSAVPGPAAPPGSLPWQ